MVPSTRHDYFTISSPGAPPQPVICGTMQVIKKLAMNEIMMMMMMMPSVMKRKHSLGNVHSPLCPLMATFGELLNEVGGLEYIYFRAFIMILGPLLVMVHRIITLPVKNVPLI